MNEQHSHYTHHVLYIEAVTLAFCSTTLPSPTVIPARITVIQSLRVAKSSASTHMDTHARNSNLSCCCAQQERALHSSESLYGIQMDETRERGGEGKQDPP